MTFVAEFLSSLVIQLFASVLFTLSMIVYVWIVRKENVSKEQSTHHALLHTFYVCASLFALFLALYSWAEYLYARQQIFGELDRSNISRTDFKNLLWFFFVQTLIEIFSMIFNLKLLHSRFKHLNNSKMNKKIDTNSLMVNLITLVCLLIYLYFVHQSPLLSD